MYYSVVIDGRKFAVFVGTYEECVDFMSRLPDKKLDRANLLSHATGRYVSWAIIK